MHTLPGAAREKTTTRDDDIALFSPTERQVLYLAWQEVHVMLARKNWLGRLIDRLNSAPPSLPLANGRLEALRRAVVLSGLGKRDIGCGALSDAGFSPAQIAALHCLFGSSPHSRAAG